MKFISFRKTVLRRIAVAVILAFMLIITLPTEAFFLKTPPGVLALLALASIFFPWRRIRMNDLFVVVPIFFLTIFVATIRIQFGKKYLIPLYAFLYIIVTSPRFLTGIMPFIRMLRAVKDRRIPLLQAWRLI
ncbi:MAG: hypothetical protein PHP28_07830 [Actinomycetota bacterium]|nr:hypothetical protein [Actinomycetota bacterium]